MKLLDEYEVRRVIRQEMEKSSAGCLGALVIVPLFFVSLMTFLAFWDAAYNTDFFRKPYTGTVHLQNHWPFLTRTEE